MPTPEKQQEKKTGRNIGKISYNHDCGYKRNLVNGGLNLEYQADEFILSSVSGIQYLYDHMNMDQDFTEQNIYTLIQKQNQKRYHRNLYLNQNPEGNGNGLPV